MIMNMLMMMIIMINDFDGAVCSILNSSKASTFLNTGSSRSHAVYTLTLTTYEDETAAAVKSSAAFQLVDLAGAERRYAPHSHSTHTVLPPCPCINFVYSLVTVYMIMTCCCC